MRELALHILDILENSVRAGATHICVIIELDKEERWLTLVVKDNGPGLPVSPEQALDPFFTTKAEKRTGLGLSLFQAAAHQAGGDLALSASESGGIQVRATFQYHHIDRAPLGDMAGSLMALLLSNSLICVSCVCRGPNGVFTVLSQDDETDAEAASPFARARVFAQRVREAITQAGINT